MDYVHFNPVKHGLATHPGAWPSSSFHRCVAAGFYPADWAIEAAAKGEFGERALEPGRQRWRGARKLGPSGS
jgi:putative transposase